MKKTSKPSEEGVLYVRGVDQKVKDLLRKTANARGLDHPLAISEAVLSWCQIGSVSGPVSRLLVREATKRGLTPSDALTEAILEWVHPAK